MIEAVMLWNEPNNLSHWDFEIDRGWRIYSEMLKLASAAVRAEMPGVRIALGGISPIDPDFILNMKSQGVLDAVDVVAVHGFPLDWNHWSIHEWPARLQEIRLVTDLPVWVSEVGVSTFGAEEIQEFGLKKTADLLIGRTPRIHWYSLYDLPRAWPASTRHQESEGSSYYRHFYMGLLREDGTPKAALKQFADYTPELGICQWFHFEDPRLHEAVRWLRRLGVRHLRTGLSWADSCRPGALEWFDRQMKAVEPFEQELVKKDHSTVIVNVGTSLIAKDEEPWAFQHIARDVTEEKRVQENLRFYVRQVSQAQEAERKRIAQELHDDTAQALVVVARNLDDIAAGRSRMSVKDVREQVRGVLQGVRRFSQQLRPSILDDLGLVPALKKLATDLTNTSSIDAHVEVGDDQHQLPPETELVLYRIVQEALTNVRKHSQADTVRVKVEFEERSIRITIIDNGKGFQVPERVGDLARVGKLGLAGMHERAELLGGTLTLDTEPGKGTIIVIEVPVMERTNSQPKETA